MGRLIDADDVMEMLTNIELSCTVIPITEAKLRLRDIPTAYDVDKVVEELEKQKSGLTEWAEDEAFKLAIHKAIEIVKQGGISDDVCEWKQDKGCVGLGAYNISCCDKTLEMPVSTARGLKYCTYCGKKIKVVQQMIIKQYQKPFVPKYANYDYTKVYYGNDIFIGWIKIYYNQQEMESD